MQLVKSKQTLKIKLDDLREIAPITQNQQLFFKYYDNKNHPVMMLYGVAGSGKTYLCMYKALEEVLSRGNKYNKVVIMRSAVPSRDIGFLPGNEEEKSMVYQMPYINMCSELFSRRDAYQRLIEQGVLDFVLTSYIRGCTIDNAIVICEESQNMNYQELSSIITRMGRNSKILFTGDFRQTDLNKKSDQSGLRKFVEICNMMKGFKKVEFNDPEEDVVRGEIVKQFIISAIKYEDSH